MHDRNGRCRHEHRERNLDGDAARRRGGRDLPGDEPGRDTSRGLRDDRLERDARGRGERGFGLAEPAALLGTHPGPTAAASSSTSSPGTIILSATGQTFFATVRLVTLTWTGAILLAVIRSSGCLMPLPNGCYGRCFERQRRQSISFLPRLVARRIRVRRCNRRRNARRRICEPGFRRIGGNRCPRRDRGGSDRDKIWRWHWCCWPSNFLDGTKSPRLAYRSTLSTPRSVDRLDQLAGLIVRLPDPKTGRPSPVRRKRFRRSWTDRSLPDTSKQRVAGSSPARRTSETARSGAHPIASRPRGSVTGGPRIGERPHRVIP